MNDNCNCPGMAGNSTPTDDDISANTNGDSEANIIRTSIDPNPDTAEYDLLEILADLEGTAIEELPSFYNQVDHFVQTLFQNPPSPEAQVQIEFSYAGYRITVNQKGEVILLNVKQSLER